jgi:surfactin synthase thioesterase subunit
MLPGDHFFLHSSETLLMRVLIRELLSVMLKNQKSVLGMVSTTTR